MLRGRVELPRFESAILAGNRLGDPAEREVLVYLPPGYDDDAGRRYPLMMVLPPYAAGHRSLLNYKVWEPDLFERYERLLAAGAVGEAILVSPDCMTRWGGSQFVDSSVLGAYQRYVVDEVLPFVDGRYRTVPKREARAVLGRSSGGFGALRLALDRPEAFAVYGSHAGDCAFEVSLRPSFTSVAITLDRAGGAKAFLEAFAERGPRSGGDFEAIMTLASAAAYAPEPDAPFPHLALPFDPRTATVVPDVWERWLAHDPLVRLDADPAALKDAALVFLDAGDRDEHGLHFGARMLAERLRDRGVEVVHEEFPGGHRGTAYRFEASLPKLGAALATP
ncbi:MAG TPA: alpha/beta hydrolase-fold protein [Sandaracinaceae bacterium LLY-WYZ-13_1]|nr:alpha/beta hydrolase-fold protein [Sandaracinaceae bacterium LLY-WYZ-13_1]